MSSDLTPSFVALPRSILEDPLWKDTPPAQKEVFIVILENACYKPQRFDDHGHIIDLSPGQFCASIREIEKLCGKWITKKNVENAMSRFEKYGFWGQEVRHKKTILTFTHPDICAMFKKQKETTKGTNWGQTGDTNKEREKDKNIKNNKEIAQTAEPLRNQTSEICFSFEDKSFQNINPSDIKTWQELFPAINVEHELKLMADWCLSNPTKAKSKKLWRKFISGWLKRNNEEAINKAAYQKRSTPASNPVRDQIVQRFEHGKKYNGAECYINGESIAFTRGLTHYQLRFSEKSFWSQFEGILRKLDIAV